MCLGPTDPRGDPVTAEFTALLSAAVEKRPGGRDTKDPATVVAPAISEQTRQCLVPWIDEESGPAPWLHRHRAGVA